MTGLCGRTTTGLGRARQSAKLVLRPHLNLSGHRIGLRVRPRLALSRAGRSSAKRHQLIPAHRDLARRGRDQMNLVRPRRHRAARLQHDACGAVLDDEEPGPAAQIDQPTGNAVAARWKLAFEHHLGGAGGGERRRTRRRTIDRIDAGEEIAADAPPCEVRRTARRREERLEADIGRAALRPRAARIQRCSRSGWNTRPGRSDPPCSWRSCARPCPLD